jgi:ariadne-1
MTSTDKIMATLKKEEKDIAINLNLTLTQLEYLKEACQVLKNAKRILKWSYAYGFYLENELQRNLYEIIQEKLDQYSQELHVLLETKYDEAKKNIGDFTDFKTKVLAAVFKTKQNTENFVTKMEGISLRLTLNLRIRKLYSRARTEKNTSRGS